MKSKPEVDTEFGRKHDTRFVPLYDRILVRRTATETIRGGIFIPAVGQEKQQEGIVVEAGPGRVFKGVREPLTVKPGDRVVFGKYAGSEVKHGGEELLLLKEEEVHGILK
jgi:chaperonin GroES